MTSTVKICAINFWANFSLEAGFWKLLLDHAFGSFATTSSEKDADIVLTGVYMKKRRWYRLGRRGSPSYPEKTIGVITENVRPDYQHFRFSISSDFDSYGGRNFRIPSWQRQIRWPGLIPRAPSTESRASHGFEPPIELDTLLQPRPAPSAADRELFCCLVARNSEPHRLLCAERLSSIGRVDLFGAITGKPDQRSKYEILAPYRFNLCFENSIFPGYYTEKLLQAWAAGCIPLYYSDNWCSLDFNPKAMINRMDFSSIDEFVQHVKSINASRKAMNELYNQPLFAKRPTLDPAIKFLRQAGATIMKSSSP